MAKARAAAQARREAANAPSSACLRAVFDAPEAAKWPTRRLGEILVPHKEIIHPGERELTREARDLAGKAKELEDAVYDLKAVNPNRKQVVDRRTPEELIALIEAKGREVTEALAVLRGGAPPADGRSAARSGAGSCPSSPCPF